MSVVLHRHKVDDARAWPIIHPTADVSSSAQIGAGSKIWHRAHIREHASIGAQCIIGKDVYIDYGVRIGSNVKIQNSALIYHGVQIEDGVFIGPQACLTNDRTPRAITATGALKTADDWSVGETRVRFGASIGAGAIILAGVIIGRFAMIGAGAVVTHDVPDYGLVVGVPARLIGYVCACGHRLALEDEVGRCSACGRSVEVEGSPQP
jgi:acetyltransferase-like isoleucine patch superfamily enzyme